MTKNGQFSLGEGFAAVARPPLRGPVHYWLRRAAQGVLSLSAEHQSKVLSMNYLQPKPSLPDQAGSRLIKANQVIF
jgi:hypothetical protein